jgi:CubicO group peptidase (beta-lactamase class C family)
MSDREPQVREPQSRESLSRSLYRALLRLHPEAFRHEFACEMLWIFDEVSAVRSATPLLADAAGSLARQWLLRSHTGETASSELQQPALRVAVELFAGEHILVPEDRLSARRLLQGTVVAAVFMAVLAFAAMRPVRRVAALTAGPAQAPTAGIEQGIFGGISNGVQNGVKGGVKDGVKDGVAGGVAGGITNGVAGGVSSGAIGSVSDGTSGGVNSGAPTGELKLLVQANAAGQDTAKTPAEQQFTAWLAEFNEGDKAKLLAFLEKNYPTSVQRIDGLLEFRQRTGGFDFKKAEKADATTFVGVVKERDSDTFARFRIDVEPGEPHNILKIDLNIIPAPADMAIPRMGEDQALAALRAEIERRVASDNFSGAVEVTRNGKSIFSGAYGLADRDKKIKNDLSTQFRIGSMNKMFTAVSALQLVQNGKLKLDATLNQYLPDYPNKDLASKVTIHQLLTHTGGTGDFFGPEFDKHRLELKTLQDYVKLYGQRDVKFAPGSKWEYSNYGFLLLGVIVQKVSGQDYYDYVRQHVFLPAGMTLTDSLPEEQTVAKRSVGYTKEDGSETWAPNTNTLPYRGTSAGGGYSTVGDLQRFAQALHDHKLLDAQYTDLLTTGKVETGGGSKYAYGFMDQNAGGVRSYGHGGGAPGMNGDLTIYPESGYVVTVLANMDPPAAQRIANFIGNRLPEK